MTHQSWPPSARAYAFWLSMSARAYSYLEALPRAWEGGRAWCWDGYAKSWLSPQPLAHAPGDTRRNRRPKVRKAKHSSFKSYVMARHASDRRIFHREKSFLTQKASDYVTKLRLLLVRSQSTTNILSTHTPFLPNSPTTWVGTVPCC